MTGFVKGRVTLARERPYVGCSTNGNWQASPLTLGPIVGTDGNGYVVVRNQSHFCTGGYQGSLSQDVGLTLLRVSPTGAVTPTVLYSRHCDRQYNQVSLCDEPPVPSQLLPDGIGGTLVKAFYSDGTRLTRVTSAGVQFDNVVGNDESISLIGDNGTAFVADGNSVGAKNVIDWTSIWSNTNLSLEPVIALPDGAVAMQDLNTGNLIQFSASGTAGESAAFGGRWGYQSAFGLWTSADSGQVTARVSLPFNEALTSFRFLGGVGTGQLASQGLPGETTNQDATAIILMDHLRAVSPRRNSQGQNIEHAGHVCKKPDMQLYYYHYLGLGTAQNAPGLQLNPERCVGGTTVAYAHSHPDSYNGSDLPSGYASQAEYYDVDTTAPGSCQQSGQSGTPAGCDRSDLWIADWYFDDPVWGPSAPHVMWYVTAPMGPPSYARYKKTTAAPAKDNIELFNFLSSLWENVPAPW